MTTSRGNSGRSGGGSTPTPIDPQANYMPGPTPVPSPAPPAPDIPNQPPSAAGVSAYQNRQAASIGSNNPFVFEGAIQVGRPQAGQPRFEYSGLIAVEQAGGNPTLYYASLVQHDVAGGLNKTYGEYSHHFDRTRKSSLWHEEDTLCLPPLSTAATSPDPAGSLAGMHWAKTPFTGNKPFIGCGSTDDACLFTTTSTTDPTIIAVTGAGKAGRDNTGGITCLETVIMNGVATAASVIVGRAGAAPRRINAIDGTVAATGHANLNPTWGAWWHNETVGFYANNGLWILTVADEISASPTQVQENMPDGGAVLGLQRFTSGLYTDMRVIGLIPLTDNTAGGLLSTAESEFEVQHWNVEGLDKVTLSFAPVLSKVTGAWVYAQGVLATDGERWAYHNGAILSDLFEFENRAPDSNLEYRIRGPHIVGQEMYSRVNLTISSGGTGNTDTFSERFDFDSWSFNNASDKQDMGSTGVYGVLPGARGLPWDVNTRYLFTYEDGAWRYWQYPNPGELLFPYRKTVGAAAGTGRQFATQGEYESPAFHLGGTHGMNVALGRVTYMGQMENHGTPTTEPKVTVSIRALLEDGTESYQTAEFTPLDLQDVGAIREFDPPIVFDWFQYKVKIEQQTGGTDPTRTNVNGLPLKFEFWISPEPLPRPKDKLGLIGRLMSWFRGR